MFFKVEFFDLFNNWWDEMTIEADSETAAKDVVRRMMGKGFVRFRAFAL
jgi:hypothetical protein